MARDCKTRKVAPTTKVTVKAAEVEDEEDVTAEPAAFQVDEGDPPIDEEDFLADVEDAYWIEADMLDGEDVFGK